MTIHKAKGLESPVVMYPILNRREPSDPLWVHVPESSGLPLPTGWVRPGKDENTLFNEEYATEQLKSQLDRLNILYVALTRPKEQLRLYCQQPQKNATTSYNALLRDYIAEHPAFKETAPDTYALGNEKENDNENQNENENQNGNRLPPNSQLSTLNSQLPSLSFPSWQHRIAIARQADDIFTPTDTTARERGTQLHDFLAHIPNLSILNSQLSTLNSQLISNLLANPDAARFFDPAYPARRETEIIFHGEVLRPDRIVETPEAIWVVDFKTGAPHPEHRIQVEHYCQVLSQMESLPVQGFLLYISPEKCQVLPVKP